MGLLILGSLSGGGYVVYRQVATSTSQSARGKQITVPVSRETIPITIAANGTVEAKQSTNVSPKSSGRLKSLLVEEGDTVKTGQPLAYMDDSDLQGQLIQAQGSLASAQANLQKLIAGNRPEDIAQAESTLRSAQVTLSQAQGDLDRYEQLYKAGAISAQSVSQYRTTRDTDQTAVDKAQQALKLLQVGNRQEDIDQARAQVTQAEGSLKTIQTQIEDAVIRAPFSGIVTSKYADPGDFVTPTTSGSAVSSATSSSILSLASTYQVSADVAETDIGKINLGQVVTITADAYPDQTFQGKVSQVAAEATITSNVTSFKVKVALTDPKKLLHPGMNVDAKFDAGKLDNVVVVPTVAIARQQNGTAVRVLTADGKAKFVPVTTGATVNNKTEIRSGLQGDEKVLVSAPAGASGTGASDRSGNASGRTGVGRQGGAGGLGGAPPF